MTLPSFTGSFPGHTVDSGNNDSLAGSGVVVDRAYPNKGWSVGDGIVLPLSFGGAGTLQGAILGFSLNFSGFLYNQGPTHPPVANEGGLPHGRVGSLYAGIVRNPSSLIAGWGGFPDDTTLVEKIWDSDTDRPLPWLPYQANPYYYTVQDNRIVSVALPQPIAIDPEVPLGIGLWLSPSIGPIVPNEFAFPQLAQCGWGICLASAKYSIQVQGDTGNPAL